MLSVTPGRMKATQLSVLIQVPDHGGLSASAAATSRSARTLACCLRPERTSFAGPLRVPCLGPGAGLRRLRPGPAFRLALGEHLLPGRLHDFGDLFWGESGVNLQGGIGDLENPLASPVMIETVAVMPGRSFSSGFSTFDDGRVGHDVLGDRRRKRTCFTLPLKVLSGKASTVKRTFWPSLTLPTSASSTSAFDLHLAQVIGDLENLGGRKSWPGWSGPR